MGYDADVVLAETMLGRYKARMLKTEQGIKLDVREFIQSAKYTGFTQKGIRLDASGFLDLLKFAETAFKPSSAAPVTSKPVSKPVSLPAVNLADIIDATMTGIRPSPSDNVQQSGGQSILQRPAPVKPVSDTQLKADISGPSVADLKARMRKGEVIPITGPGSLAEAIARDKGRKAVAVS